MPHQSELLALVQGAKHYDPQALAKLCELYYRDVCSYIYYWVSSVEYAQDLTNDVFSRMVESVRSCRSGGEKSFLAWLFRFASNCVVDYYRRRAVRNHLPLDEKFLPPNDGPEDFVEI